MASNVISGMCRCCASEGTFKDMTTAYHWMGEEEVYDIMLRECFDISLTQADCDASDRGICEVCITQLRNASNFKKQVLLTEEQFKLRLENKLFKDEIVKIEPSKDEEYDSDDQNDVELEVEFAEVDYTGVVKDEEPEAPRTRKRAAKASTSRAKRSKADGETSKRSPRIRVKPEFREPELEAKQVWLTDDKPKPRTKGESLEKHRATVREILLCTNATPIKSKLGIGYACCFCADQYPNPADLKRHTIENHDTKTKSSFMKGKDLSKFYVKMDITDLHCNLCKADIDTIDKLINHLKEHDRNVNVESKKQVLPFKFTGGDTIKCAICGNDFHTFRVLVEHMNLHFRNYICEVCDAGFVSQSILFQHAKTHKLGTFQCDYCSKVFDTLLKKRSHERVVHTHTNVLNKCGYCLETFKDYWQRLKHLASVHGVTSPVFKCQACDKTFHQQKSLRIHTKRDHLMERPHACNQCEMKFFTAKKLTEHMVKHTGLREFQCKVCLKFYGRKKTLNQHMRVHDDYCRFKCEKCGQGFVQRNSWVGHMRTKHGESGVK